MLRYVPTNTHPHHQIPGRQVTFLITNDDTRGHSCTLEMLYEPGAGTGLHAHHDNDEQVYVLDGEVTMQLDRETIHAAAGDIVFIPCGVVHAIQSDAGTARLLKTYTPGDIEWDIRRRCGLPVRGDYVQEGAAEGAGP